MQILSMTLVICSLFASIWAFGGLIRPKWVLWWAVPEKQSRWRALCFALLVSTGLYLSAFALPPAFSWWTWGIVLLIFFVVFMMHSSFCMTQQDAEALLKEQERIKKANLTKTIFSMTSDKEYKIRPFLSICSCPDWKKKRSDADGPFAVCKHLANHYVCHEEETPSHLLQYQSMFLSFSIAEKGMPTQGAVSGYGITDGNAYIFTGHTDNLPWVNVYTSYTGDQQFGVNIETDRWARGEEPPFALAILEHIKKIAIQ